MNQSVSHSQDAERILRLAMILTELTAGISLVVPA